MKILILASWYPSKHDYVSGIFIKEQVKALKKVGVEPIVFYPYDKSIKKNHIVSSKEEGILTYRGNTDYMKNTKISKINSILKSIKFLKKIVLDNNVDLIHSHVCYTAGFISVFYKKLYKVPYVITEHMSKVGQYSQKFYNKKLFKVAYENAEKVITVSSFLSNELSELGFNFKKEIIGNVVNVNEYEFEINKIKNEFNILFIGIMGESEVKGLNIFIPALANFIRKNNENSIKFHLVGDGVKRKNYEVMCKKLNIEKNCIFYGAVDKSEIPKYISKCDFLVLPSIKETFGSVLIEAMAGGKPVLTTKCGGPQEFVNDKVGVLVDSKKQESLEEGLEKIIKNYEKYDPIYIRNYVLSNYSYDAIGNKLKALYKNILMTKCKSKV